MLIVGGGIGGLVTAMSLHQAGIPCQVFESVASLKPLGVGINVLPHAVRELTELGLRDRLEQEAVETAELSYFSKRGDLIWSEPRGKAAGYHWPQFSIHRGTLQMALFDACVERIGADNVLTDQHLVGWDVDHQGVTAHFTSSAGGNTHHTYHGSVMIGADGMHSTVRKTLYPDEGVPIWNGAVLWRGVSEARGFLTGRTMIMAGHEFQKFVCYPIQPVSDVNECRLTNWVAEKKYDPQQGWRREDWNRQGDLSDFLPDFERWRFPWLPVPDLIRSA
ncbi:MAG: NAD(P)-binding protein, partial [Chromatiales bacterium]|nr:NAD(P)-binding protein [Chromatiales bacterium]